MRVIPDSINLRKSDREIEDGFLQESVNLQWRDGSNKPIPKRLVSEMDTTGYYGAIAHKIGDENQINILAWKEEGGSFPNYLHLIGKFVDGVYTSITPTLIGSGNTYIVHNETTSFTVLNGLLYFMSSKDGEEYYYQVQYDETDEEYLVKDAYEWKDVEYNYPNARINGQTSDSNGIVTCGVVMVRYAFTLNTGEMVMPSTIYPHLIIGYCPTGAVAIGDSINDIHTIAYKRIQYPSMYDGVVEDNISGIKVYSSIPYYKSEFTESGTVVNDEINDFNFSYDSIKEAIKSNSDQLFYEVGSFSVKHELYSGSQYEIYNQKICLYVDSNETDLSGVYTSRVDMSTIAAGSVMPVDNFTHHKIYGKMSSFNGRITIESPAVKMTSGIVSNIGCSINTTAKEGFYAETEDGILKSPENSLGSGVNFRFYPSPIGYDGLNEEYILTRGLLCYPDIRANKIAMSGVSDSKYTIVDPEDSNENLITKSTDVREFSAVSSLYNNISTALDFDNIVIRDVITNGSNILSLVLNYNIEFLYNGDNTYVPGNKTKYTSNNAVQFSEAGEFSVFPAINSYRVGDGNIVFVGSNRVNPENADVVAPLIVGTTDGIYTVNLDITGDTLINSITKTANLPAISSETLELQGSLMFVSDKGLMVINNGNVQNLTNKAFPDQGDGFFPDPLTVYANYDILQDHPVDGGFITLSNYRIDDIVKYMKGAVFAYDGRRNNIWCSNPSYPYSLIYSAELSKWSMCSIVFEDTVEFYSTIKHGGVDYYTRYLVDSISSPIGQASNYHLILSGEDNTKLIAHHMLTRPIKLASPDVFKKFDRLIARCQLKRGGGGGVFNFGLWGKQDVNKDAVAIPLVAISDDVHYKNDIRQDIPIGSMKGKYKAITVMLTGESMPDSSIDCIDIGASEVDGGRMR